MGITELLLVVAVGGGILAVLFATFRGAAADARADEARDAQAPARATTSERLELEERSTAVVRALDEIDADRDAGNLSEADYQALRRRYEREAAAVLLRLGTAATSSPGAAQGSVTSDPDARRLSSVVGWTAGVISFAAVAVLVMSTALRPRVGDDTITGGLPGRDAAPPATGEPFGAIDTERLAELERTVAADSTAVDALVELGRMYLSSQRLNEVTRVSLKALELDPDNPGALTNLGMVLVAIDHVKDGLASFDRALSADPEFADALLFKGMVLFQRQDFQTAVDAWERYLEVAPPGARTDRIEAMLEVARTAVAEGTTS